MEKINTYKALSNDVYFFGIIPLDAVFFFILDIIIWGISNSLIIAVAFFIVFFIIAKKIKTRSKKYINRLLIFFLLPKRLGIRNLDIPVYKDILEKK